MLYRLTLVLVSLIILGFVPAQGLAESLSPAQTGESLRADLLQAQLALLNTPAEARRLVADAQTLYQDTLANSLVKVAPQAHQRIQAGFAAAEESIAAKDERGLAMARAQIWTGLLAGSYQLIEAALQQEDGQTAREWLPLREFRQATRFSRPNADATLMVKGVINDQVTPADAILALRADLLDTYQARLTKALGDLEVADESNFAVRRAEHAALAEGYFSILSAAYKEQRGPEALAAAQQAFADLRAAAYTGQNLPAALEQVKASLHNFRAAPLSPKEQSRRAGQLLRYLSLIPIEYERGVSGGQVIKEIEIQEAVTFRDGAAAAFADLQNLLDARNTAKTTQAAELFATLQAQLSAASTRTDVPSPEAIQANTDQLAALLTAVMPAEWQQGSTTGDFDVIFSMLDQMETAVRAGEYDLAESARLEAYAILEVGPEARLIVFAPQLKLSLEELFWNGQGQTKGLAYLIKNQAPLSEIKTSRAALEAELTTAQELLSAGSAPAAILTNAWVIVFREGLETVLILASLMGSLKSGENRKYRRPLWWGAILALVVTGGTWLLAHGVLNALARYGEKLEAVISLLAIGVLLLITNWFFHQLYWTDWLARFHSQKRRILSGETGLLAGLVMLGFTSVYREGFEVVLFLQALVLEGGLAVVLSGVALGLVATVLVGIATFVLQARLPYKKMLIVTGIMIGGVLLVMVGNTVHVLQVVGWLPIHPLVALPLPYWMGIWFGLYPTWEGLLLQAAAAIFVIGSYYLAEWQKKHRHPVAFSQPNQHSAKPEQTYNAAMRPSSSQTEFGN
jgi:high-affinity iron transporter